MLDPSLRKARGACSRRPDWPNRRPRARWPRCSRAARRRPRRCASAIPPSAAARSCSPRSAALRAAGLPAADAARCLCGVDVDPTAAALAALAVHESCGPGAPDPLELATRIRCGDGLRDLDDGAFDCVLTNPPWETLQGSADAAARVAALRSRFHHQGRGKLYTYRLFVERCHRLLRDGGRFGLVVPASLWFDRDAAPLRDLLLDRCDWEWLYGFENRRRVFAIDGRYRFAVAIGTKGGRTAALRTAFGRVDLGDWQAVSPPHVEYPAALVRQLSPAHRTFVEVEHAADLAILATMAAHGAPLLGRGGAFAWRQGDFNMTADRGAFVLRSDAEAEGYARGDDAVWRGPGDDLLPLWQGAMIYDLHPNAGAHRTGTGHATTWEPPRDPGDLRPQYLVAAAPWRRAAIHRDPGRIALRALSNATNERTAVACLLPDVPCGNSLGVLTPRACGDRPLRHLAAGAAVLGSLPFDWALRRRLTGTNLNAFVLADCVLPRLDEVAERELARLALRLSAVLPWHAPLWQRATAEGWADEGLRPATAESERRELLTAIDVAVGHAFALTPHDVERIATDDGQRGFHRVDRELPADERRPRRWCLALTRRAAADRHHW
ncbi:MAG: hypothetical protein U1E73_03330 [Planctomycetota bacterium]